MALQLVKAGADVNACDVDGKRPLMYFNTSLPEEDKEGSGKRKRSAASTKCNPGPSNTPSLEGELGGLPTTGALDGQGDHPAVGLELTDSANAALLDDVEMCSSLARDAATDIGTPTEQL